MRRIGSNIRKQNSKDKAHRITKNIIVYSESQKPKNDYPKKIVSPPSPSKCCTDKNRDAVGNPDHYAQANQHANQYPDHSADRHGYPAPSGLSQRHLPGRRDHTRLHPFGEGRRLCKNLARTQ